MKSKVTPGPVADIDRNTQSLQLDGVIMPATLPSRSRVRLSSPASTRVCVGTD